MASKTKIYIVLEFVTGGELFDKIVRLWLLQYSAFLHVNNLWMVLYFSPPNLLCIILGPG